MRPSSRANRISDSCFPLRRPVQVVTFGRRHVRRERFFDDLMARTVIGARAGDSSVWRVRAAGRSFAKSIGSWLVRHLTGTRRDALCPAGSQAGKRIAGLRPVSLILTRSVRAVRMRQRAVAESSPGLRLAPSALLRATPQKSPPWLTRCSSTPPTRRRPA